MKRLVLYLFFVKFTVILSGCNIEDSGYNGFLGQNNSMWTQSMFLRGYKPSSNERLEEKHIQELARNVNAHKVKYVYIFAGPFQSDGHLPKYGFSQTAINSVRLLKSYSPQLVILPWIGGIQNKTVYLEDSTWVQNALTDTKKLIETLKVSGVHVDFEFLLPGDPYLDRTIPRVQTTNDLETYGNNVNLFHAKLRKQVPTAFISSVVLASIAQTKPWKRKTTHHELEKLIQNIDQLCFLYYDTQIDNQYDFSVGCLNLIQGIDSLSLKKNIQYLIGIGTFTNEPQLRKYRNMQIENVQNTLNVIRRNARDVNSKKRIVDGIAIYCDWATDQNEWNQFKDGWVKY